MSNQNRSIISRRDFLRTASAVGVGALLMACTPSASPSSDSGSSASAEGVEIKHWAFWTQMGKIQEMLEETDEFKEAIGNNTWEYRSGIDQEARLAAIAGGTPPDVGTLVNYLDFMARGVVIALDDYIEASDVISPDKFIEGNWEVVQYKGNVYGVPAYECFVRRGLGYNARMVEEAGLDPDNPPVTWAETFAWHEALTKFDDAGNLIQIGLDPYDAEGGVGPGNDGWYLTESWGFEYFNEDTGEFNLDDERMAIGLETMGEFIKLIGPDNLAGMRGVEGQGTWGGAFNAEVQAMIVEGYWHPGETANEKPEVSEVLRTTWVPVPEERRGTQIQFGGGHMAMIFAEAEHKDEAWPIIEFFQSNAACDIIFNNIGWLPAYKPYFDNADPNTYTGLKFYFDSIEETNYWGPFIRNEIGNFINQKFREVREQVYRGELSGADAAAKLQDEAVKEWKAAGFG
ncbi:substrate-binding domain-containing protein [Chloroflexi bacterium TSY]|nr:substrate-binding domain-containing protein [Chloroflexi bacterium TSY]